MPNILISVLFVYWSSTLHAADKMTVAYATLGGSKPRVVTSEKRIGASTASTSTWFISAVARARCRRSCPAAFSFFMGSDTAGYVAAIQGAKVVKLGVTMNTLGYFLMTAPEIRSIADLKGKVLGVGLGRDLPIYI